MPRFEPFPGLRYDLDRVRLSDVVAPPYDVVSPDERQTLQARSAYNSIRIELPDAAVGLDPYQAAARRLSEWRAEGVLRRDPNPSFYGYRMGYDDPAGRRRHTVGVIGALGLEPPGTAGIFPHERTTPKAKSDRLQLLQATRLNTSPIWGLSLAGGLSNAVGLPGEDDWSVTSEGVQHELWPIVDPRSVAGISAAVSAAPVVIADGHHRFETALTYRALTCRAPAEGDGAADSVMALVVELVEDQLSVQAIHRLISGLPADFDIVGALGSSFDPTPTDAGDAAILLRMEETGSLGLITREGAWLLRSSDQTTAESSHDLDASRLETALRVLPEHEVAYQHGFEPAAASVQRGDAQAAVLLRPVTVEQIASTGRGAGRMPPKTTFFWPKPRTGMVFRDVGG